MKILIVQDVNVIVDDSDFDEMSKHPWVIGYNGYAEYKIWKDDKTVVIRMHRLLLGIADTKTDTDHIDGNRLNNCRSNLRKATRQQNSYSGIGKGVTSVYKGVSWSKGKYRAFINNNYKTIYLISSSSEDECGYAYNVAAQILAKEFAYINPIQEQDLSKYNWIKETVEDKLKQYVSK